ncbi:MAG: AtpZ/AtpI family protein [Candidatus Omnitrophica bacterium]|nr:AtpZ/AtpI family protein [Candidatus Omnitrophota bacterium]MBI3083541.1 AtpZ/AtpI family protein [Candidatus Omnitrophota bacterium]
MGEFLSIPLTLALVPIAGVLVGWFFDRRVGTFPWLTIVGLALGFIGAARELRAALRRAEGPKDKHA